MLDPIPPKARRMHWSKYTRLVTELLTFQREVFDSILRTYRRELPVREKALVADRDRSLVPNT